MNFSRWVLGCMIPVIGILYALSALVGHFIIVQLVKLCHLDLNLIHIMKEFLVTPQSLLNTIYNIESIYSQPTRLYALHIKWVGCNDDQ